MHLSFCLLESFCRDFQLNYKEVKSKLGKDRHFSVFFFILLINDQIMSLVERIKLKKRIKYNYFLSEIDCLNFSSLSKICIILDF